MTNLRKPPTCVSTVSENHPLEIALRDAFEGWATGNSEDENQSVVPDDLRAQARDILGSLAVVGQPCPCCGRKVRPLSKRRGK